MNAFGSEKMSLEGLKRDLSVFLSGKQEIIFAYLFGSCLRGKTGGEHDIDIAVFFDPAHFDRVSQAQTYGPEAQLVAEIIHLLKYNLIDLVILNKVPPLLAYEVIHNGAMLFCKDQDLRIEFEISSLKRHADTKHLREIKRRYMQERIEEGLSAYAK